MSYSFVKLITFSGATAAVGSGVAAGTFMFSESKEKSTKHKENSSSVEKTSEINKQSESERIDSVQHSSPACVIYEASNPSGSQGNRRFDQLLKRFESKESFFEEFNSGSSKPVSQDSKSEIDKACNNQGSKKNVKGRVYLWWGVVRGTPTWIYALDMHKEDNNWENDQSIKQRSGDVIPSS